MEFVFVGGNLALDLLGTLKWRRTTPEECLGTPALAARWAVEAGVLTAPPRIDAAGLARLRDLREAVYRLVRAALSGGPLPRADLHLLNAAAAEPGPAVRLTPAGARRTGTADTLAAEVARAAITLLDDVHIRRTTHLRECERPDCTRLFIDRSRGGTRTWCGMSECGNRAKAASYRARKAAAEA